MVQYPIELQKYFDEIKSLEKAYATKNKLTDKKANPSDDDKEEIKIEEEPTTKIENKDDGAKVVEDRGDDNLVVKDYEKTKKDQGQAKGETTQFITGGLKKRKLVERPALFNETTKKGNVKLSICVNGQGKVTKATVVKSASTKDAALIKSATKFAKKYKFNNSSLSRQCGYLVIEFK
jgi:outer membrane biosynthesis protein TonB